MPNEIRSIQGPATAKVISLVTFFFLLLFMVPVAGILFLVAAFSTGPQAGNYLLMGVVYLLLPLLYLVLVYLMMRLYCWLYNRVAARVGGIRFTLEDVS